MLDLLVWIESSIHFEKKSTEGIVFLRVRVGVGGGGGNWKSYLYGCVARMFKTHSVHTPGDTLIFTYIRRLRSLWVQILSVKNSSYFEKRHN